MPSSTKARKKKAPNRGGRPKKFADGSIAFNMKLAPEVWAALKARADRETQKTGHVVSMGDVARTALGEWLLACAIGQRPSTTPIVATPKQESAA